MVASSLAIVAAMVARSASFCARWRSSAASLAANSDVWLTRNWRCIVTRLGGAAAGGRNSDTGSSLPLKAARKRATSSCAEVRSLRKWLRSASFMVGSSSIRTCPALTFCLPVADVDGPHDAGLERLDDFGASTWDDFSRRRGDDVDLAKRRPGQGQAKQRNDRHTNGPPDWRGRRLDDFQRRRQKRELMLVTATWSRRKRDDVLGGVLSGLHGFRPAGDRARRSGRQS